ncbi:BQ5605_C013g07233 [Microbotryum silenes-dioicae]|uniref:BQ5605_C013g07233 protein n=1 Tax=Microbotryum silenes-dioicae TaxID=796604 RepID=A0A2X0NNQ4_9BASI|nr:BQ5605_C013g07233 [Microbotryum silenes-dioicae]
MQVRVAMSLVHRTLVRRAAEILIVGSALVHSADVVRDYYMPWLADEKARVERDLASENRERFEILQERLAKAKALVESRRENGARAD